MELFTLSAYETSAEAFFRALQEHHADLVLDVRLRNSNQLCGFTKERDLAYFVPLITGAKYFHDLRLAPYPALLSSYQKHTIDWARYRDGYLKQMKDADTAAYFYQQYGRFAHVCLLGTATKKRRSHSEALLEYLQQP
jgi:hypothetical protein